MLCDHDGVQLYDKVPTPSNWVSRTDYVRYLSGELPAKNVASLELLSMRRRRALVRRNGRIQAMKPGQIFEHWMRLEVMP